MKILYCFLYYFLKVFIYIWESPQRQSPPFSVLHHILRKLCLWSQLSKENTYKNNQNNWGQNKKTNKANFMLIPIVPELIMWEFNPNSIRSYKIVQKLSPKHAARGVAQSPYPIYRYRKACLSKQPPWRAAGDPRLARGRSRVQAPGPAGTLRALFFSTLPSFLLREIVFLHLPHQACG